MSREQALGEFVRHQLRPLVARDELSRHLRIFNWEAVRPTAVFRKLISEEAAPFMGLAVDLVRRFMPEADGRTLTIAAVWLVGQCSIFVRNREQLANPPVSLPLDEASIGRLAGPRDRLGARRARRSGQGPRPQEIPGVAPKIPCSRPAPAHNGCLKFNRPFEKYRPRENGVMRFTMPLLRRFFGKLIHDILPAALASLLGGFLITHFQLNRPPEPVTVPVAPASPEMMQLLRDEHGLIGSFVKAQIANEKNAIDKSVNEKDAQRAMPTTARRRSLRRHSRRRARRGRPRSSPWSRASRLRRASRPPVVGASLPTLADRAGPAERKRAAAAGGAQ